MQKGFTLIELIAVIMIIGILLILVIPKTIEIIQNSKSKAYNAQISKIQDAAALYMNDNSYSVTFSNNVAQITLQQLISGGYIDPVTNPKTGAKFIASTTFVNITKSGKTYTYSVAVYASLDKSGANAPVLASNMIPVYYDTTNSVWKKADMYNSNASYKWYDYTNKMWANAVTVTASTLSAYKSAAVGTTVAETDILTYLVWVPRYKYLIPSGTGARTISITFESASTTKSTGDAITTYLTHPAFTFGSQELSGIWIGKFETTGTIGAITTKPNLTSLSSQTVSSFYTAIRNMEASGNIYGYVASEVDTHLILNTEWGATAYLTYSIYGKNSEVWINPNSNYTTGQAGTSVSAASTSTTYPYNDMTYGVSASTTGNVYGIYDMSGGSYEYVMGNLNNGSGYSSSNNSGFSGYNGNDASTTVGLAFPDSKYYNLYTNSTIATACNGAICYGQALSETSGWNGDYTYFVNSSRPWLLRGNGYYDTTFAGIFSYNYGTGKADTPSTRVVVTTS